MASAKTRIGGEGCRSASLQTPYLYLIYYSTGLKTRGYSPFGLRVFQTPLSDEQ
ncbi:MAG: hypothetical protein UHS50_05295 [Bacteroidaceae bacterium]|nr:hypothetical protein [Bacteroidaceae bacterium]